MADYVLYHNAEQMGGPVTPLAGGRMQGYTDKPVASAVGGRCWVVSGQGTPRRYFLEGCFRIEEATDSDKEGFEHRIEGAIIERPTPTRIDQEDGFTEFLAQMANFSLGFTPLPPAYSGYLPSLIPRARVEGTAPVAAEQRVTCAGFGHRDLFIRRIAGTWPAATTEIQGQEIVVRWPSTPAGWPKVWETFLLNAGRDGIVFS